MGWGATVSESQNERAEAPKGRADDAVGAASFELFGVRIDTPTMEGALERIVALTRRPGAGCTPVAFVNADCMNIACHDWTYKRNLDSSALRFADGTGLRMAARKLGHPEPENVNGTDLFPMLCARSVAEDGPTIYLLGGKPGVAARCADRMAEAFHGVRIVGARDGYFSELDEAATLAEIAERRPDILLVAMGVPLQEDWIARNLPRRGARVAMGVGGLFDFYSGDMPRAPRLIRERGMEWVWRLLMEPRRMFRRYIVGNPLFLYRVSREAKWRATRDDSAELAARPRRADRRRRLLDIAASLGGLAVAGPLMLAAALAIRLESRGPVLFSQQRIGRDGVPFTLWKLRTMRVDAEAQRAALEAQNQMAGGVLFKLRNDPRVTRVGTVLRKYSIDELPQLWNVLRGDMALVGPRPALPSEVAQYTATACERLRVKPGLTGLWQISGRSSLPFEAQVRLDIENAARRSLRFDTKLLARTVPAVVRGSGAW